MAASANPGWRPHFLRVGDGKGGWSLRPAQLQFLHAPGASYCMPFGVAQMDNGELILLASAERPGSQRPFIPVVAFSPDRGDTWSEFQPIPDWANGRPMMLTWLGGGDLCFQVAVGAAGSGERCFSRDCGRTWTERCPVPPTAAGGPWSVEGNPLVDRGADGRALRLAEIGYDVRDVSLWPKGAFTGRVRWSSDGGRTWEGETAPEAWKVNGRGVSEGSLVRAANGWLVAALRLDMPARYLDQPHDDSLEGLGISLSRDEGKTWSPIEVLFEAGRHHPHLLLLPSGEILMTYIVRDDVRGGGLASYMRGCEALLSRDHGRTWDLDGRMVLDEFAFFDGVKWYNGETGHLYSTLLGDGAVLTCYGKYLAKGAVLIRWRPEV
jgi:hypothetical protein